MKRSCLDAVKAHTVSGKMISPSRENTCIFVSPQNRVRVYNTLRKKSSPIKIIATFGQNAYLWQILFPQDPACRCERRKYKEENRKELVCDSPAMPHFSLIVDIPARKEICRLGFHFSCIAFTWSCINKIGCGVYTVEARASCSCLLHFLLPKRLTISKSK